MFDITESDWKKWKSLRLQAIDRFCNATFDQVQALSNSDEPVHDRHRKLYSVVTDRDREIEQLFDPLTRSRAVLLLANLYRNTPLVSDDDISQFSEALQSICRQE